MIKNVIKQILRRVNIKQLFKSEYARDASTLMIGTTVGMLITMAASPILSRLYGDEAFGVLQLFSSAYTILCIIATLRFELAILLPKDDSDGFNVLMASCGSSVIIGGLMQLGVFAIDIFDISLFGLNQLTWLNFLPATVTIMSLYNSFNYWMNRRKRYFNLAINRIIQNFLVVAISIVLSEKLIYVPNGMLWAYIGGYGFVTVLLVIYTIQDYKRLSLKFDFKGVLKMAKRYRRFPISSMPTGLINNLAVQMPVFILTSRFGEGFIGQYYMMNRVLGTPVSIVGQAIGDVFRQKSSQSYAENGECKQLYFSTAKALALASCVPFLFLMIVARPAFTFILGEEWTLAGTFVVLLAPFYFIRLVVSPLTSMTIVAEKQTFELIWQSTLCIVTSGAMLLSAYFFPPNGGNFPCYAVMCSYALAYSIMYGLHFIYTSQLAKGKKLWG